MQFPVPVTPGDALQISPVLAVTVTLPVGTPAVPVTEKSTVTTWPTVAGLGVWEVIVVVLAAVLTVSVTVSLAVV